MSKILYLEGASGISGDMTVAALLDSGADAAKVEKALAPLSGEGLSFQISKKSSYSIAGTDFDVILPHHNHEDHHEHGHHHHEHRNLHDVCHVIDHACMTEHAKLLAKKIFTIVAEAEAQAHGCSLDQVHFHEVGALDSIADIVSTAVLIDDLGITECVVTGLTEGTGTVHCQHGDLPVPVPAVLNIAQKYNIPLRTSMNKGEMVTPTGIAIAAALRTQTSLPDSYTVDKVGIGLGKRDLGNANILRAMLLSPSPSKTETVLLECNIDDSTGEELGLAMESLLNAGALDVHYIPCFTKKDRPAWLLRVLTTENKRMEMEKLIFQTTTTIGIRHIPVERTCMERKTVSVDLPDGKVLVKVCTFDEIKKYYPEYESVKEYASRTGRDFHSVYAQASVKAQEEYE